MKLIWKDIVIKNLESIDVEKKTPNQKYYYQKNLFYGVIEKAMDRNNISYQEIVDEIDFDININTLSYILENEPNITLHMMIKLADVVGLDMKISYNK